MIIDTDMWVHLTCVQGWEPTIDDFLSSNQYQCMSRKWSQSSVKSWKAPVLMPAKDHNWDSCSTYPTAGRKWSMDEVVLRRRTDHNHQQGSACGTCVSVHVHMHINMYMYVYT